MQCYYKGTDAIGQPTIKDLVKDQQVHFQYFTEGELWYKTDSGFLFPVPVTDKNEVGTANFNRDDKAILFMRYIRKYKEMIDKEKEKY